MVRGEKLGDEPRDRLTTKFGNSSAPSPQLMEMLPLAVTADGDVAV
jgi:hypothetical protein